MKRVRGVATFVVLALEAIWGLYVLGYASDGAWSIADQLAFVYGGIAFGLFGAAFFAVHAVRARRDTARPGLRRFLTMRVLAQPLFLGLVLLGAGTELAFRARFAVSRGALERYAAAMPAERTEQLGARWIGLFHVRSVDRAGESVRFFTGPCFLDDCGVAFSPAGEPPRIGEDSYEKLTGEWWRWRRSW